MAKFIDDYILRLFEKNLREIRSLGFVLKFIIYIAFFCFASYIGYVSGGKVSSASEFISTFIFIVIGILAVYAFHFYNYSDSKFFRLIVLLGGIGALLGLIFAKAF